MAWTSPRTWAVSEFVTAALLNTHVRDNLLFLKSNPVIAEGTSATTATVNGGSATVINLGSVAIPADVGAVYVEAWANALGCEARVTTSYYQAQLLEASAGVLRRAGLNLDLDQRLPASGEEWMLPLYFRSTELAWAGTSRTVSLAIEAIGCTAVMAATADSPITLRIVRAY